MLTQQQAALRGYEGALAENEAEHRSIKEAMRILESDIAKASAKKGTPENSSEALAKRLSALAASQSTLSTSQAKKHLSAAHRKKISIAQRKRLSLARQATQTPAAPKIRVKPKAKRPSAVAEGSRIEHARHSVKRTKR